MPEGSQQRQTAGLTAFERFSFGVARLFNERFKVVSSLYQRHVLGPVFKLLIGRILQVRGLENVTAMPRGTSFMLVSNHRSFFDFYLLGTALYQRGRVARRIYFPVRATFFYQSFLGLLVNTFIGGFSMYPPVFRERQKLAFNRWSMDESARLLTTKQAMVGIHPEGTRGQGPDPYVLLPAQPGAGRVARHAQVPVIPAFVLGTTNALWSLFKRNWSKNGAPVYAIFGPPMQLDDLYAEGDTPPTHKRIADRMRDTISALGQEQRRGEHGDS